MIMSYCAYSFNYLGHIKCLIFVYAVLLFHVKCDDLPRNAVVMAGADKVLNCAEGGPFRWYRYLPSDPSNDKVLFMGSQMADDIDHRFRVLKEPHVYPFQRLDLIITNVQADDSGTYKCKQPQNALCAELIVLGTEPNCRIHMSTDATTKDMAELRCNVNVTENGQPEMLCEHQNKVALTVTSCSARHNGMVTCLTKVPAEMKADYTCFIKIKHKPLRNYRTCIQATNEPDYQYTWQSSSADDEFAVSSQLMVSVKELSFIIALCCSAVLNAILFVICLKRKRMKDGSAGKNSATSSVETLTSDCESLTASDKHEEVKGNLDSESSCILSKIDV